MPKLSYYNTVNVYGTGDYLPLHNSGISNSRIFPSSLINQYLGFTGNSGKVFANNGSSGLWITATAPGGSNNQVQFNSGGLFGGSSNFIYDWTNNRFGFHGANNASLPVSFASTIGPSGNNSIDLGHVSYVWATGHFNGLAFSGARFNGAVHYGIIYNSGNTLKTEAAFIYDDVNNRLYSDLITVTGLNVVGSHTGILPDQTSNSGKVLATNGTSTLWVAQGASQPGGSDTHIQYNSGGSLAGSSNFIYDYTNNRYAFQGLTNSSFGVTFKSGIGPSGNNSVDFGHASYVWGTGHFNGIAFSGARFNGSTQYGIVYSSGSNLKTESAFIYDDVINRLYVDLITVTGLNVVGSHTGILPSTASNSGKVLTNDGGSVYSWISQGASQPGGSNTHIQFNSGGSLSGKSTFSFDYTNNVASLTGTLVVDTIIVNSSISGAAYTWPMVYGWSFPSGVISGTGTNVSYEIPILTDCILQSGGYSQIRAKVAGSGHVSGFMVDINYNGTSIWNTAQSMRLNMPNNARSGNQPNFSYSGILERGGYLSLDFDFCPTGILAQDVIIELMTMSRKM